MSTLASSLSTLLTGVHPAWLPFFEEHGLMASIQTALERVEADVSRLAPEAELIFEFLRYFGPDDVLVLIMGQDPYPQDAQGLCFSIPPEAPLKASLKSIMGNLEAQGLARRHFRVKGDMASGQTYSGDLRTWASQGVILMNASLTTRVGARGAHKGYWKTFATGFVKALTAHTAARGRRLICMLWGNDARAFAPAAEQGTVYHWTHPSPLINNRLPAISRFECAPHFKDANLALRAASVRPIEWDPLGYTYAFTDGSCPRNGQPDAEASYAAYVLTGPLKGVEVSGRVEPLEYALVDPADPLQGFASISSKSATPTNNRGEYLAWCWVLLLLLRGGVRGRIEVVSDCNLFIQTMENWLPTRRRKGTAESLKNYDLVCIGETLLAALRNECKEVTLTHINSHQKRPSSDEDPHAQVFWYGNDRVDRVAGALLKDSSTNFVLDTAPPLAWSIHGRYAH